MADYAITSQMKGPDIDVSLFPEAMKAGAQVGNMVKTPLQAAAEGITQGVENFQNVQLKQAQVEQIPLRQQQLEQQVREAELDNQMKEVQAEATVANREKIIDNKRANLEDQTLKLDQDIKLRQDTDSFDAEWQNLDNPLDKKKLLFGGQYSNVFSADPKKFKQAGSEVYQWMSPEERASFNAGLLKSAASSKYDQDAQKWQIEAQHTRSNLHSDPDFVYSVNAAGLTPEDAETQLVYKQHGSVQVDPNTRMVKLGKTGWAYNTPGSYDAKDSTWDVFTRDGKLIKEGASADSGKAFNLNTRAQNYVNGTYKQRAVGAIDSRFQGQLSKPPAQQQGQMSQQGMAQPQGQPLTKEQELNTPTLSRSKEAPPTPAQIKEASQKSTDISPKVENLGYLRDVAVVNKGVLNLTGNNDLHEVARTTVGITKDSYTKVKPYFNEIFGVLESPKSMFGGRYGAEEEELESAKSNIVKKLASLEFNTTPGIKDTYNERAVEEHNAKVEDFKAMIKTAQQSSAMLGGGMPYIPVVTLDDMVTVQTPEELFRVKNKPKYDKILNRMISSIDQKVTQDKRAALKNKATPNAMLEIINQESQK